MNNDLKTLLAGVITITFAPIIYKNYNYLEYATLGAVGMASLVVVGYAAYGLATLWQRLQEQRANNGLLWADVAIKQAEATRLSQNVTVIKAGEELVLTHINYPMQLVSHSSPHGLKADLGKELSRQLALPAPVETIDPMATIKTGAKWINELLFDDDDKLKFHQFSINGATGAGKTYFMLYIMSLIQQPHPKAEYWLLDPKYEGKESGWPFEPFVTDFEQMAVGAEYVYKHVVTKRKHDKRLNIMPKAPAFIIVDEIDGAADDHGDKFVKPIRKGIKEGRSGWVHYFIIGQSSLIKENGLSGAIFRNTCRFIIGNEALAFTRNAQFTFWEKAARDVIAKQLIYLQENKKRGVLVIPPSGQGLPFVGEIPDLPKPSFSQAADVEQASQLMLDANTMAYGEAKVVEDEVIRAMVAAYEDGATVTEVARLKYSSEGTKQNVLTLRLLEKAGVTLRSDDVAILAKGK